MFINTFPTNQTYKLRGKVKTYEQQRLKVRLDDLIMEMHLCNEIISVKDYYRILKGLRILFKGKGLE